MSLGLRFFSLLLNSYLTLECICIFRDLCSHMQYLQLTAHCTAHRMCSFHCLLSSSCCAMASASLPSTMSMFPELLPVSLHTWPWRAEQAPQYHDRVLCHVLDYPYLPQSSFLEGKLRLQGRCCQPGSWAGPGLPGGAGSCSSGAAPGSKGNGQSYRRWSGSQTGCFSFCGPKVSAKIL